MLTKNEISALSLSPTKKDFVQIWNELLETASKLSERWDPTSTNESDPGIVILKAVTGIADKLNYNIDKNTLEAFMPTAAQEDSMRKLCDMLGYNIKYYRSAVADNVTIKYHNAEPTDEEKAALSIENGTSGFIIPKFTVLTNIDKDVNYFTIEEKTISAENSSITVTCMEGQIVKCESINDNNVINANQISENNRFYLPETQVAENGIFVYNVFNTKVLGTDGLLDGIMWEKVDNLNIIERGSRVYKFGFDSYEGRPYLEFPDDYSELFEDGIFIYYARTNGVSGNISAGTLTQIELPTDSGVSVDSFSVNNPFAATTGANVESIKQAYNSFKKTIGTFETLVTCRDYMNKIYTMLDYNGKPLVSNILVTDIRNDLNRAVTICSCDNAGIFYKETALTEEVEVDRTVSGATATVATPMPVFDDNDKTPCWRLGDTENGFIFSNKGNFIAGYYDDNGKLSNGSTDFDIEADGEVAAFEGYWVIRQNNKTFKTKLPSSATTTLSTTIKTKDVTNAIDHFDLVLYPFKSYNQIISGVRDIREVYDASFGYSGSSFKSITDKINEQNLKTIAHNFKAPRTTRVDDDGNIITIGDIVSINNYLRLNVTIATNSKITVEDGDFIKDNIKIALANAFNMRELDFGEEIPFDSIVDVIENSDPRIRVASLNDPALYTSFSVLVEDSSGNPSIKEYAVASDTWLTEESASKTGRFDVGKTTTTFNTKEAKKIYNKLAVRNVLAGRVPLFKYNNTFETSFSEGPYRITRNIAVTDKPKELHTPTPDEPYTIYVDGEVIYTSQLTALTTDLVPADLAVPSQDNEETEWFDEQNKVYYYGVWDSQGTQGNQANYSKIVYTVTETPEELPHYRDCVITDVNDNIITSLTTECNIHTDKDVYNKSIGEISDVTLANCEYVKFRAPNFITTKTYPAYVNYRLKLATSALREAAKAEAETLFYLLNSDREDWSLDKQKIKWQRVLDYFEVVDNENIEGRSTPYKRKFTIAQKISAYSANGDQSKLIDGNAIVITIDNNDNSVSEESLSELLHKSGCVKLTNERNNNGHYRVNLKWAPDDGETAPNTTGPDLNIELDIDNPFITSESVLDAIKTAITDSLNGLLPHIDADGNEVPSALPTECSWTVSVDFECVPLEPASLAEWENFIRKSNKLELLGFTPATEGDIIFWRTVSDGNNIGKYVMENTKKLAEFKGTDFDNLSTTPPLKGIYVAKTLGKDAETAVIADGEEYQLGEGERLYIEYKPSSTTEDATADQAAVTEVYGKGTIIRPSGFETGFMDSTAYEALGNSHFKEVTFKTDANTTERIRLHSFGANEQVEIREFSRVVLDADSFKSDSAIYLYKNFNNCPVLETGSGERVYTLKDGEYIFYTDKNKTEFAYFTSGTQVMLKGNITIPEFDIVDIASIFESGMQAIPWQYRKLYADDSLTFQEYQYINLGPEDTIKKITLTNSKADCISNAWQFCNNAEYSVAGSDKIYSLAPVRVQEAGIASEGCGWEVCSTLVLDTNSSTAQTLRNDGKVEAIITLESTSSIGAGGSGQDEQTAKIRAIDAVHPVSFKTNLACQTSTNKLNIKDIYSSANKANGLEFKVFTTNEPAIVETVPGKLIPHDTRITDITDWPGESLVEKDYSELWNSVSLSKIKVNHADAAQSTAKDTALRLPVTITPDTYGVFTIYVDYTSDTTPEDGQVNSNKVWIELLPGTSTNDISLLHLSDSEAASRWEIPDKDDYNSPSKLYLNSGINCLSINKTSIIFIKADAHGTLLFDDLKLVDCPAAEYTDNKGNIVKVPVHGLNVKQLGYLNVSDEDIITKETCTALINGYVKEAVATLDKLTKEQTDLIDTNVSDLSEVKQKIQALVAFIERANSELASATSDDNSKLLNTYKDINARIIAEEALLNVLTNSSNNGNLVQKLADIQHNFLTLETVQQELLKALNAARASALLNTETISDDEIFEDFIDTFDKETIASLKDTLQAIAEECVVRVNAAYYEQLPVLYEKLSKITDSDDKAALSDVLAALREEQLNTTAAELSSKVRRIIEVLNNNQEQIDSIISAIKNCTSEKNYVDLAISLDQLCTYLASEDLADLAVELELATDSSNFSLVGAISAEINDLLESNADIDKDIAVRTELGTIMWHDVLLADVYAFRNAAYKAANTGSTGVLTEENIKTLCDKVYTEYYNKVKSYIENASALSKTLSVSGNTGADISYIKNIENTLLDLQNIKNDYVASIARDIIMLGSNRSAYLESIATFAEKCVNSETSSITLNDINNLQFGRDASIYVWRSVIKQNIHSIVNDLYTVIYQNISKAQTTSFDFDELSNKKLICNIIGKDTFERLLNRSVGIYYKNSQNNAYKTLISNISKLIPENDLSSAFSVDSTSYTVVINSLITKLSNDDIDVTEKQQLLDDLKNELESTNGLDKQLLTVVATALCPSILLFKESFTAANSDEFYASLANEVKTCIDSTDIADGLSSIKGRLANNTDNCLLGEDITGWSSSKSLLPGEYKNKVTSIIDSMSNKTDVSNVKDNLTHINVFVALDETADENTSKTYVELVNELLGQILSTLDSESTPSLVKDSTISIANALRGLIVQEDGAHVDIISSQFKDLFVLSETEKQLLSDIRSIDKSHDFYYTAPVELHLAIEFNESDSSLNTLMNPLFNYDTNNINNNFVISKLDIDYLTDGIQIARSSRLN